MNQPQMEDPKQIHAGELAHQLESLPAAERSQLWESIGSEERGAALPFLHDEIKASLIGQSSLEELQDLTENMAASDVADVIEMVPDDVAQDIVDNLSEEAREQVEESLSFDDEMVGRWLQHDELRFAGSRSVQQILSYIRKKGLPKYSDRVFLVGPRSQYRGAVALSSVLEAEPDTLLRDLDLLANDTVFNAEDQISTAALELRKNMFVSAAVINTQGHLLGRITAEDAIETLQDAADHQFMSMAGMDEEDDLFAPIASSAKRRAVWLGINLLTAFLASYVIGVFEATVQQMVALAVLMPIVASMGGIAGSQTLTIVIRGLALDKLNENNTKSLLIKELGVGFINGLLWAAVVGVVAQAWFGNTMLGVVIASAILINVLAAAFSGILIPLLLHRLKMDPALSGSVILTTVTDVVGFMSFLGLATVFLI